MKAPVFRFDGSLADIAVKSIEWVQAEDCVTTVGEAPPLPEGSTIVDGMIEIDFGPSKLPQRWYFMVIPVDADRRHMWMTKQYAVGSHEDAVRAWIADGPAQEFMRPFLASRGAEIGGYYVARWSEECLNDFTLDRKEYQRRREEAKWVEPRWFDADGKEVRDER